MARRNAIGVVAGLDALARLPSVPSGWSQRQGGGLVAPGSMGGRAWCLGACPDRVQLKRPPRSPTPLHVALRDFVEPNRLASGTGWVGGDGRRLRRSPSGSDYHGSGDGGGHLVFRALRLGLAAPRRRVRGRRTLRRPLLCIFQTGRRVRRRGANSGAGPAGCSAGGSFAANRGEIRLGQARPNG